MLGRQRLKRKSCLSKELKDEEEFTKQKRKGRMLQKEEKAHIKA